MNMDNLRNKASKRIVELLIIFGPSFLLMSIREQFRLVEMGNTIGTLTLGVIIGCLLLYLIKKLNIQITILSALGVVFLANPYILYLLVSLNPIFNYALFWLISIFTYMILGALLFIKSNQDKTNKTEMYIASLVVVYLILALMVNFININVLYSPDSYSYYDMSQSIISNFGMVNTVRQYQLFTEYAISFPYLFPMIIWFVNTLTGFSIYSGTIINLVVTLISIYYLIKISLRLTGSTYPGLISSVIMIYKPEFLNELMAARAVPLSVLCALLVLDVVVHSEALAVSPYKSPQISSNKIVYFFQKKSIARDLFLMGVFAGAGMVIRFDFLAISGLLGVLLVLIFTVKKDLFKTIPFYVLGLLVFAAPWLIYSVVQFQSLWISDNNGTMALISPLIPQRFFHPDEIIPNLHADWEAWVESREIIFVHRLSDMIYMMTRPVTMMITFGITVIGVLAALGDKIRKKELKNYRVLLACIAIIYIAKSIAIFLVGYGDLRYHSETVIIISLIILCSIFRKEIFRNSAKSAIWSSFVALVCFVSITSHFQPVLNELRPRLVIPIVDLTRVMPSESTVILEWQLMEYGQHRSGRDVRLFSLSGLDVFEFGAHSNILTFGEIANINEMRLLYLVENFIQPNYIHAYDEFNPWVAVLSRYYLLNRVFDSNAFALTSLDNFVEANTIQASDLTDVSWNNGINLNAQTIIFENTPETLSLLENAVGLRTETLSVGILEVIESGEWIHVNTEDSVRLNEFAYPNEISILQ